MSTAAHIENIAWCIAFVVLVVLLDGWAAWLSLIPLLMVNYQTERKR